MTANATRMASALTARMAAFIVIILAFALFPVAAEPGPTAGQPAFPTEFARPIEAWNRALDRINRSLDDDSIATQTLEAARANLDDLHDTVTAFLDELRPRLDAARALVDKLGAAPAANQPAEPESVVRQREEAARTLADLTTAQKAGDAALVKVRDLTGRTRDLRRVLFERQVLQRVASPLSPRLLAEVAENLPAGVHRLFQVLNDWWQRITPKSQFLGILLAALVLWAGLVAVARQSIRHYRLWQETEPPSDLQKSASAAWVILLRAIPATAAAAFLYFALTSFELLPPPAVKVLVTVTLAIVIVGVFRAVARTVLAVNRPQWRLLKMSGESAARLYVRLLILAVLYALDILAGTFVQVTSMSYSLSIMQSFLASTGIAVLIMSILRIRAGGGDAGGEACCIGPRSVRVPLWLVAFAILGAALTGYVALARFIAGQLVVTGMVLIIAYLFLIWAGAFGASLKDSSTTAGHWLSDHAGLSQRRREQLSLPVSLLLKGIVILVAVPFILLMWGFDARDVAGWVEKALFGFEIGNFRVSLTTAVIALAIFAAAFTAAKTFQLWLDNHVMEPAGVDNSVRDSVRTGIGYLGVGAAILLAVSYAGFDFSNLAIVAGALSVGLGFGMQSVVNNFVSGLILLAERPIKVGDWIVVGTDEGIVRRISVRSTEIETFDSSSVIIPNSQLISQTVKNWTLHNNTGRMSVAVGVHYDSDPEVVRDILLKVANAHPQVLPTPEPFVYFSDFGNSALNFTLYVYLANVRQSVAVRTDLRIGILKLFQARGIEIPYPQTEVHLRDLAWIKRAIVQRMKKDDGGVPMTVKNFEVDEGLARACDHHADGQGD